jgi:hypothetical protein
MNNFILKKTFFHLYGNNNHLTDPQKCTPIKFYVLITNLMSGVICQMSHKNYNDFNFYLD